MCLGIETKGNLSNIVCVDTNWPRQDGSFVMEDLYSSDGCGLLSLRSAEE